MQETALISETSTAGTFALLFVILALAAFGFWSERTRLGQVLSGVILVIVLGLTLSNLRIIPFDTPLYGAVWSYTVPLAIPLLLFKADLRRILPALGPLTASFVLGVVGTMVGVVTGYLLVPLGPRAAEIVATLGASWIGGSMNFAAVSQAISFDDPTLLSAMVAADNVGGTLFLLVLVALPGSLWLRRIIPSPIMEQEPHEVEAEEQEAGPITMQELTVALALSGFCCAGGYIFATALGIASYGILFVTLIALAIANLFPQRMAKLSGDFELGMFFMYVFFAVMGAGANVAAMVQNALGIFAFVGIMAAVHLSVVLGGAKLFKLDLAEALIASNAVALGPATAAAMAASQRWQNLVTPAVMLGVLGYASANFLGVAMANLLP